MLDIPHDREYYMQMRKHINTCGTCDLALKNFEQENFKIKIYIPKPQIDNETKDNFKNEVSEIFKSLHLNEKNLLRLKIKKNIKRIDSFGIDLIEVFTSKKMITTYAFAGVLFVILKRFFN